MLHTENVPQRSETSASTTNNAGSECSPFFLLRVTGMPFTSIDQLQFPHTVALIEEILAIEDWQKQSIRPLLTALTTYAEHITEKDVQHKNLDLRRAIANNNGKKADKLLQTLASYLPETLSTATDEWCQHTLRRTELISNGEPTLQAELRQCRKTLHHLYSDENFQRGLLLSSPTLYTELQYYLATPPDKSTNRLRRAEEGLFSYLVRAATKTSPYSTFTSTSPGTWQELGEQFACMHVQSWQQNSTMRFHTDILQTITQMLATRPEVRPYLHPALNSSLSWMTDTIHTAPSSNSAEKVELLVQERQHTLPLHKRYNEHLFRLKLNPLLSAIIHLIDSYAGKLSYDEIVAKVVSNNNLEPEGKAEYTGEMVRESLEYLAKRSIIAIDLRIPEHEDDAIKLIIKKLAAIPGPWVAKICETLQYIDTLKDTYSAKMAHERVTILKEIKQYTLTLCHEIGSLQNPPWDGVEQVEKCFPGLLLEDTALPFTELTLSRSAWQPVLNDLATLQKFTALVSEEVVWKMMLDCLIKEDREVTSELQIADILHYHEYVSKHSQDISRLRHHWRERCPQLVQWVAARQAFTSFVTGAIQQTLKRGDKTLILDPTRIAHLAEAIPPVLQQRFTLDHFGQLFIDHGEPQCVLNSTWLGPGTAFSRFSYMFEEETLRTGNLGHRGFNAILKQQITRLGERHGGVYASLTETAGLNVNIHSPFAPYEILLPHSVSLHSIETQLHLSDLRIVQVPETAEIQLWSQRLQKRIFPIHMGFSIPTVLSPLYQRLVSLFSRHPSFNMVAILESDLPEEQKQRSRHYPRIALGHVVLNRESWKLPFSGLPQRNINETAFDYFLKVNRWRKAEDLPVEGFRNFYSRSEYQVAMQKRLLVNLLDDDKPALQHGDAPSASSADAVHTTELSKKADTDVLAMNNSLRKPFYTNFHNYFLVNLLGSALKALPEGGTLTFEEMLPTRPQHLLRRDAESYATECIIEVSM